MDIITLKENPDLISSSIPVGNYTDYAGATTTLSAWVAGTYGEGDIVYLDSSTPHTVWESIEASNTDTPSEDSTKWSFLGYTDRYKMLELRSSTQSQLTTSFDFEIDSSYCDSIGFFGLQATQVDLELWAGGSLIKSTSAELQIAEIPTWYNYYFSDYRYKKILLWHFPFFASSTIKVTITWKPGELAKCGIVGLGNLIELGKTTYNPSMSIKSYSVVNEDAFGIKSFTRRARAKKNDIEFYFTKNLIDSAYEILEEIDATPAIFNANNPGVDYQALIALGFYRSFDIQTDGPNIGRCTLSYEEIV